jgi:hypothetical protein
LVAERPLTDFHTYYRKKLRPYLLDLEQKREDFQRHSQSSARNHLILAALLGLGLGAAARAMELFGALNWGFVGLMVLIPPAVMHFWVAPLLRQREAADQQHLDFYYRYKTKVVESMVRFFDDSMRLQHEDQVPKEAIRKSGLVQELSDLKLDGDDFVSGSLQGIPVSFSELRLESLKPQPQGPDKAGSKQHLPVFHGAFFHASIKQPFPGSLFVVPKSVLPSNAWVGEGALPKEGAPLRMHHRIHNIKAMEQNMALLHPWNPAFQGPGLHPVLFPCPQANASYVAYSTHPQEAQRVLSQAFCQQLIGFGIGAGTSIALEEAWEDAVAFRKTVNHGCYISVVQERMSIMQPQGGELFEPDMEHTFLDEGSLAHYHDSLRQAFNLIEAVQACLIQRPQA